MKRFAVCALALLLVAVVGCTGAKSPDPSSRATARVALVSLASLVELGFNACADYVEESGNAKAGHDCLAVLRPAKDGIYAAADAMKAWQTGEDTTTLQVLGCAAKGTMAALEGVKKVLTGVGVETPPWAEDALSWARWAAAMALPTCNEKQPATSVRVTTVGLPPEGEEWAL
jgi:hypothetical protein